MHHLKIMTAMFAGFVIAVITFNAVTSQAAAPLHPQPLYQLDWHRLSQPPMYAETDGIHIAWEPASNTCLGIVTWRNNISNGASALTVLPAATCMGHLPAQQQRPASETEGRQ